LEEDKLELTLVPIHDDDDDDENVEKKQNETSLRHSLKPNFHSAAALTIFCRLRR
jgi:hypothetical protein